MSNPTPQQHYGPIDVLRHRWYYLGFSLLLLIPGVIFILLSMSEYETHSPVRLGIDFTGGSLLELGFEKKVSQDDVPKIKAIFEEAGYPGSVIQIQEGLPNTAASPENTAPEKATPEKTETAVPASPVVAAQSDAPSVTAIQPVKSQAIIVSDHNGASAGVASVVSIRAKQIQEKDYVTVKDHLQQQFGTFQVLQRNSVGPTLASELLSNGLMALLLAYVLIVGYLTYRFQFDYAVCAIIALAHDTLTVFGVFAMLGYLFHIEVDSMFVTGILTVVGFSVHDTIVVFDRLRENTKRYYSQKLPFAVIANMSVNQTLARSINTSLTALLTLFALYFFGGETTKEFVLCMILGIAIGTYSSIFVASAMLVWWRERHEAPAKPAKTAVAV